MSKIEIKEENMNLKLILISTLPNHSNIELNLQKKNINEMIDKFEGFHFIKDKHKIQLKSSNLKNINSIHSHNNCFIFFISLFFCIFSFLKLF